MAAGLTLLIVLILSVMVVRTGAVALRLTGLSEDTARFQARSAFSGTGFTTSESEAIVNHPVRRRIISLLMLVGSLGFVSVLATVVVSLIGARGAESEVLNQLLWLVGALVVLCLTALNRRADRMMCAAIGKLLERTKGFGARTPERLLQLPSEHSVTRILAYTVSGLVGRTVRDLAASGVVVLALQREDGTYLSVPSEAVEICRTDELFLYGPDRTAALAGFTAPAS